MQSNFSEKIIDTLHERLSPCILCPRNCKTDRMAGINGFCCLSNELKIFCANLHFGEEPPISGTRGSGTVFFSGCNLKCIFCQNFAFSQLNNGEIMTPETLADKMLELQKRGAHNINWVTPTPQLPFAIDALKIARENGLTIPLVYNCGGYESVEILQLLDGIVDIYLPDAKYSQNNVAEKLSHAKNYPEINRNALKEMYRQIGALKTDENGIATRGMIIRHLVLPNNLSGTREILSFIANELGIDVTISLMHQYFPAHLAINHPEIGRKITWEEYQIALEWFDEFGFDSAFIQEWEWPVS